MNDVARSNNLVVKGVRVFLIIISISSWWMSAARYADSAINAAPLKYEPA